MENSSPENGVKYHNNVEVVNVTYRNYEDVMHDLRLPDSFFSPGQKVLSVGEGLSTFAKTLKEKGVDSYAVDMIYAYGEKIITSQHDDENSEIEETPSKKIGTDIRIHNRSSMQYFPSEQEKKEFYQKHSPEIGRIAAADVAGLPFPENSFDVITADHLTEYVDLERTIKELIRVIKPGGEIRLGGVGLRLLLEHKIIDNRLQSEPILVNANKLNEACQWLGKQQNISVWAVLDQIPETPEFGWNKNAEMLEKFGEPAYIAGTLVIKKDTSTPPILGRMEDAEDKKGVHVYARLGQQHKEGDTNRDISTDYPHLGEAYPLTFEVKETRKKNIFQKEEVVIQDGFRVTRI